jgi:hypothetical protein
MLYLLSGLFCTSRCSFFDNIISAVKLIELYISEMMLRRFSLKHPLLTRGMSSKNSSEFKSFFRLRLQDRPIKLAAKVKETYRTNKKIRKAINAGKYIFGKSAIRVKLHSFQLCLFCSAGYNDPRAILGEAFSD